MDHVKVVLDRVDHPPRSDSDYRVPNGISDLNRFARPFESGQLWAIIGVPGVGRSTLAAQWAARLGLAGLPTVMVSMTGRAEELTQGVLAHVSGVSRERLFREPDARFKRFASTEASEAEDAVKERAARQQLEHSQLMFEQWSRRHQQTLDHLAERFTSAVAIVVLDDIDMVGDPDDVIRIARTWCDERGSLVIVTCPRSRALTQSATGTDELSPTWSRLVDATVEVEGVRYPWGSTPGPDAPGPSPGREGMRLVSNRWGPRAGFDVYFDPDHGQWTNPPQVS